MNDPTPQKAWLEGKTEINGKLYATGSTTCIVMQIAPQ